MENVSGGGREIPQSKNYQNIFECRTWVRRKIAYFLGEVLGKMTTVFDVASYILQKCGEMTTWKLQKLVYYCQAWSLVWDEEHLFKEKIEAWANGPVVRELYDSHKGKFFISRISKGNADNLEKSQRDKICAVIGFYGKKSSQYLSDLTHMEEPWRKARRGIFDRIRSNKEITYESMSEYYGSLLPKEDQSK